MCSKCRMRTGTLTLVGAVTVLKGINIPVLTLSALEFALGLDTVEGLAERYPQLFDDGEGMTVEEIFAYEDIVDRYAAAVVQMALLTQAYVNGMERLIFEGIFEGVVDEYERRQQDSMGMPSAFEAFLSELDLEGDHEDGNI